MKITEQNVRAALDPVVSDLTLTTFEKQRMVQVAMASGRHKKCCRWIVLRRMLATAAAAAVFMATSMVVLASPALSAKLSQLSQQTLRYLSPVSAQCESNGISMEVLASMQDDDTVVCYISFTDVTDQKRLDDTLEICDISIDGEPTVIYGEPTLQDDGSVVLRVQGQRNPMQAVDGKVSLSLNGILTGEESVDFQDTGSTVGEIRNQNPAPAMAGMVPIYTAYNSVADGSLSTLMEQDQMQVLKPVVQYTDARVPFLEFQNGGIINGALHLLAKRDPERWYDTCKFMLYDAAGQMVPADSAEFGVGEKLEERNSYSRHNTTAVEYVLSIPEGMDPDTLSLYYATNTYKTYIEGNWDVTFAVPDEKYPVIHAVCNQDMNPWTLQSVDVSPFGVECMGTGLLKEQSTMPDVCLYLQDGSRIEEFSSSITTVQMGMDGAPDEISIKTYLDEPLDLRQVEEIQVGGQIVWRRSQHKRF